MAEHPLDSVCRDLVVFKHENGEHISNSPLWMDSTIRQHWLDNFSDEAVARRADEEPEEEDEEEVDYNSMTNDDLRAELLERKLSLDGKKADMVARLIADDEAAAQQ